MNLEQLDFGMNFQSKEYTLEDGIKKLSELEWKRGLYEKQSWGNSMHRIGPYVGRIKPVSYTHLTLPTNSRV